MPFIKKSIQFTGTSTSSYYLVFDGTNEYVTMGNVLNYERNNVFSFAVWFKTSLSGSYNWMLGNMDTTYRGYSVLLSPDGYVGLLIQNGGGNLCYTHTDVAYNDGEWHCAVLTYDGSSQNTGIYIYIDGNPAGLTYVESTLTSTILDTAPFIIGGLGVDLMGLGYTFTGSLDDVSIWDKELSSGEVSWLYNGGTPPNDLLAVGAPSDLRSWWRCGDGDTYPKILDHGHGDFPYPVVGELVNEYDGTMTNGASSDVHDMAPYGKFITFDGSDDYITMGDVLGTLIDRYTTFTVSVWVRPGTVSTSHVVIARQNETTLPSGWNLYVQNYEFGFGLIHTWITNCIQTYSTGTVDLTDELWHHIVITYDGSGDGSGVSFYFDGQPMARAVAYNNLTSSIYKSGTPLTIGKRDISGSPQYYPGSIDNVTLWNKELSAAEVLELHNDAWKDGLTALPCDPRLLSMAANLVAWWPMGEGDVYPNVYDRAGGGYDGTMTLMAANKILDHNVNVAQAYSERCILTNGLDERITVGDVFGPQTERDQAFSWSAWIYTSTPTGSALIARQVTGGQGWSFEFRAAGVGLAFTMVKTWTTDCISVYCTTSSVIHDNRWHHVVVTYDGSGAASGVTFYVDSHQQITLTQYDNLVSDINQAGSLLTFSARDTDTPLYFNGRIDEVSFWTKELAPAEVLDIYNQGVPKELLGTPELAGYWHVGEDIPNDGMMTNMEAGDIVAGGLANTYINLGNVFGFNSTQALTFSIWFKTSDTTNEKTIISKQGDGAAYTGWRIAMLATTGRILFEAVSDNSTSDELVTYEAVGGWHDGEWHHLVVILKTPATTWKVSEIRFYVDGVERPHGTVGDPGIVDNLSGSISTAADTHIGNRATSGSTLPFIGQLCFLTVYDGDIGQPGVVELYNGGNPPNPKMVSTHDRIYAYLPLGTGDVYPDIFDHALEPVIPMKAGLKSTYLRLLNMVVPHHYFVGAGFPDMSMFYPGPGGTDVRFSARLWNTGRAFRAGPVVYRDYDEAWSVSFWIRWTNTGSGVRNIYTQSWGNDTGGVNIKSYYFSAGQIELKLRTNAIGWVYVRTTTSTFNNGNWHHVCVTYAGTRLATGVHIWVDGVDEPLTVDAAGPINDVMSTTSINLNSWGDKTQDGVTGNMSQIAIYNRVLNGTEVGEIYNGGVPVEISSLASYSDALLYSPLGASEGGDEADKPGTLINMDSTNVGNGPGGVLEDSLMFDGVNETVSLGNSYNFENDQAFSFSGWFKVRGDFWSTQSAYLSSSSNPYISMGNVLGFEYNVPFSVSFWVKTTTSSTSWGWMVQKTTYANPTVGWSVAKDTSNRLSFLLERTATDRIWISTEDATQWRDGTWRHVCITYDGSVAASGVTMYIDGVAVSTTTLTDNLTGSIASTANFTVGKWYSNSMVTMRICELGVWDKELSATEVTEVYNGGDTHDLTLTSMAANLQGYWYLGNGDTTDTFYDHSGNGYTGTRIAGTIVINNDAPEYIPPPFTLLSKLSSGFRGYEVAMDVNGSIVWDIPSSTTNRIQVTTTATGFNDGTWHQFLVTYDASLSASGAKIYVDGSLEATSTGYDTLTTTLIDTADCRFGSRSTAVQYLPGELAGIAIHAMELQTSDATDLYNGGTPVDPESLSSATHLVGYWDLGDGYYPGVMVNMSESDILDDFPYTDTTTTEKTWDTIVPADVVWVSDADQGAGVLMHMKNLLASHGWDVIGSCNSVVYEWSGVTGGGSYGGQSTGPYDTWASNSDIIRYNDTAPGPHSWVTLQSPATSSGQFWVTISYWSSFYYSIRMYASNAKPTLPIDPINYYPTPSNDEYFWILEDGNFCRMTVGKAIRLYFSGCSTDGSFIFFSQSLNEAYWYHSQQFHVLTGNETEAPDMVMRAVGLRWTVAHATSLSESWVLYHPRFGRIGCCPLVWYYYPSGNTLENLYVTDALSNTTQSSPVWITPYSSDDNRISSIVCRIPDVFLCPSSTAAQGSPAPALGTPKYINAGCVWFPGSVIPVFT